MKKIERRIKGKYNAICSYKLDHWRMVAESILRRLQKQKKLGML